MNEIERVDITGSEYPSYSFLCRGCGKRLHLHFNGGELDEANCCGFRYKLEAPRIDFVVLKKGA